MLNTEGLECLPSQFKFPPIFQLALSIESFNRMLELNLDDLNISAHTPAPTIS